MKAAYLKQMNDLIGPEDWNKDHPGHYPWNVNVEKIAFGAVVMEEGKTVHVELADDTEEGFWKKLLG